MMASTRFVFPRPAGSDMGPIVSLGHDTLHAGTEGTVVLTIVEPRAVINEEAMRTELVLHFRSRAQVDEARRELNELSRDMLHVERALRLAAAK